MEHVTRSHIVISLLVWSVGVTLHLVVRHSFVDVDWEVLRCTCLYRIGWVLSHISSFWTCKVVCIVWLGRMGHLGSICLYVMRRLLQAFCPRRRSFSIWTYTALHRLIAEMRRVEIRLVGLENLLLSLLEFLLDSFLLLGIEILLSDHPDYFHLHPLSLYCWSILDLSFWLKLERGESLSLYGLTTHMRYWKFIVLLQSHLLVHDLPLHDVWGIPFRSVLIVWCGNLSGLFCKHVVPRCRITLDLVDPLVRCCILTWVLDHNLRLGWYFINS